MNRENLKKLADGLRGPLLLPFDMGEWVSGGVDLRAVTNAGNGCGTAACACGHATYLVEPKHSDEGFRQYATRVFGVENRHFSGPNRGSFDWCFSGDWDARDNTPQGAADRIEWMLENGVPGDWYEQLYGHEPLCYRNAP